MTGNLTLGTDKITLDASDGSASFAGTVQPTDLFVKNGKNNPGQVARFTGAQAGQGLKVLVGAFDGNDTGVTLQAGSLTKGSKLEIHTADTSGNLKEVIFGAENSNLIRATADSENVFDLHNDGSAKFAGTVDIGSTIRNRRSNENNLAYACYLTGNPDPSTWSDPTIQFTAGGSASFTGVVEVGDDSLTGTIFKVKVQAQVTVTTISQAMVAQAQHLAFPELVL